MNTNLNIVVVLLEFITHPLVLLKVALLIGGQKRVEEREEYDEDNCY